MFLGNFRNFDSAYWNLWQYIEQKGFVCNPRNKVCKELRPASFTIDDPTKALYTGTERKLNLAFHAVEVAMYIAGRGGTDNYKEQEDTRVLCAINRNMMSYVNKKTGVMDGAYGPRMREGLDRVYRTLKTDQWSRQAVVSIWNNDENTDSLDVPCTCTLHFYCTDTDDSDMSPLLNLSVYMRSNDINWGTPYDVAAFCEIQCWMADALGFNYGVYYHNVGSLHVYNDSPPNVEMNAEHKYNIIEERRPVSAFDWKDLREEAGVFLDNCFMSYYDSNFKSIVLTDDVRDKPFTRKLKRLMKHRWKS